MKPERNEIDLQNEVETNQSLPPPDPTLTLTFYKLAVVRLRWRGSCQVVQILPLIRRQLQRSGKKKRERATNEMRQENIVAQN